MSHYGQSNSIGQIELHRNLLLPILAVGLVVVAITMRSGLDKVGPIASDHPSDKEAENEAHQSVFVPGDTARLPGIDVSHFQGKIDWNRVASAGITFAYSKATEGVTDVDARFATNQTAASTAGLAFGAYHFFEPNDDPVEQAKHFLSIAQVGQGSLPPVVDVERASKTADVAAFSQSIEAWIKHVLDETGCQPLVYASPSFFTTNFNDTLTDAPYWLAEYSSEPHPPSKDSTWTFWQHSQTGAVDGISGAVDLDWFAGDEAGLRSILCE